MSRLNLVARTARPVLTLSTLIGALLFPGLAEGQSPPLPPPPTPVTTRVVVKAPQLSGALVDFVVDGATSTRTLASDGTATFTFSRLESPTVDLRVRTRRLGHAILEFENTVALNGSGRLEYTINADGTGMLAQWPAVTWQSTGANLDVALNGTIEGSTPGTRGVAPMVTHTITWRRGNTVVCSHSVTLPVNVKKVYVCNPATGAVTEP